MSVKYAVVQWNQHKRIYDAVIVTSVVLYLGMFVFIAKLLYRRPNAISDEILAIRALGSCAFLMLHVVLCTGPLARIDKRFLPLLYNRRHLGIATFLVALLHGILVTGYYHGFGNVNALLSLLGTNTNFGSLRAFPFQILGLAALAILFVMAATSHDFWNKNLGPTLWKAIHMLVYPAYALIVMHVVLGAVQAQRGVWLPIFVGLGALIVATLHLVTGLHEYQRDRKGVTRVRAGNESWIDVCGVDEIEEQRGKPVCVGTSERIAVFRYDGVISAIANVCAHQGGPLGEGKILEGCVTCPWHGWQYRPSDGRSPPPFKERISTYRVRVDGQRVLVDPRPLPPGTPVEPARISESPRD
jgi:nitrite reductase/ring-hydroxylating ferredoxin subunit/DMSO/TMAO reductase YedYZ heme-binding membrane subunit